MRVANQRLLHKIFFLSLSHLLYSGMSTPGVAFLVASAMLACWAVCLCLGPIDCVCMLLAICLPWHRWCWHCQMLLRGNKEYITPWGLCTLGGNRIVSYLVYLQLRFFGAICFLLAALLDLFADAGLSELIAIAAPPDL